MTAMWDEVVQRLKGESTKTAVKQVCGKIGTNLAHTPPHTESGLFLNLINHGPEYAIEDWG